MGQRALNLPRIGSYAGAEAYYSSTNFWRGESSGYKPLVRPGQRKWRQFGICKNGDGSYDCRLWNTDVITFHPDDRVTFRPWGSISTNDFVNKVGPGNITADYCHPYDNMIWVDVFERTEDGEMIAERRGYSIGRDITFKRSIHRMSAWRLDDDSTPPKPLTAYRVDRKKAKAMRDDLAMAGMQNWFNAVRTFEKHQTRKRKPFERMDYERLSDSEVVGLVKQGFDGWKELAEAWGYACADRVLMACYRYHDCIIETEVPYLIATNRWGEYNKFVARQKRYGM